MTDNMKQKVTDYTEVFRNQQPELYRNDIPDAEAARWIQNSVPLFECSDALMEETYYFRWWTFRKHIRSTPEGRVITEFLPQVGWSGDYNTISCPVGHHFAEGRWMNDPSVLRSYARFWLKPERREQAMKYTNNLVYSIGQFCLRNRDLGLAEELYPALSEHYSAMCSYHRTASGLFWSNDDRDGMEYSISGSGLRPTVNSYQYGAAATMAQLADFLHRPEGDSYRSEAAEIKCLMQKYLWDRKDGFFKTVPADTRHTRPDFDRQDRNRDVMEEIGFIPWCYAGLTEPEQETAFRYLKDEKHFAALWGITTADRSHPLFMKNPVRHECLWDGPVWPYATSQTLTGIYTLLTEKSSSEVTAADYMALLRQYAASQILTENGKTIRWIDEDQEPFTGQWISRDLIRLDHIYAGKFREERGANYNHSTFCDLVLSGACGISIQADHMTVKPLAQGSWDYFSVQNFVLRGRKYDVFFDADGTHYGLGARLTVFCDGQLLDAAQDELIVSI